MPYTFLTASLPIQKTPKQTYVDQFQSVMDLQFKNSSDWYTINKETSYGSGVYSGTIDVRINFAISNTTGLSIGDDFKRILFKQPDSSRMVGDMYYFSDNYWIVTNTEEKMGIASTCVVRRCNNVLRWKSFETGKIEEQPCVIDYIIKETRDYSTSGSALVLPSGFAEIMTQFNSKTNKIRPSRRFLFGNTDNWNAFKVMGGGINNYNNSSTTNNSSVGLLRLSVLANQVNNQTDDIVNGIADASEFVYSLSLSESSLSLETSKQFKFYPTLELNGETITKNLTWSSSNPLVATVSSTGVVTTIIPGTTTITCSMTENSSVYDTCPITVVGTLVNNYVVVVEPNVDYVYEGQEQIFTVSLYLNNIAQVDAFVFTLDSNTVPSTNYTYSVLSSNSFKINNLEKFLGDTLIVGAVSGIHTKNVPITLKGAW